MTISTKTILKLTNGMKFWVLEQYKYINKKHPNTIRIDIAVVKKYKIRDILLRLKK